MRRGLQRYLPGNGYLRDTLRVPLEDAQYHVAHAAQRAPAQQVEAIRHMYSLRCSPPCSLGILAASGSGRHLPHRLI